MTREKIIAHENCYLYIVELYNIKIYIFDDLISIRLKWCVYLLFRDKREKYSNIYSSY